MQAIASNGQKKNGHSFFPGEQIECTKCPISRVPPHPSAEAQVGQTGGAAAGAASSGELPRRRRPTGGRGMRQWDYAANSDGADG